METASKSALPGRVEIVAFGRVASQGDPGLAPELGLFVSVQCQKPSLFGGAYNVVAMILTRSTSRRRPGRS